MWSKGSGADAGGWWSEGAPRFRWRENCTAFAVARLRLSESRAELVPAMPSVSRLAHEFHSGAKLLKIRETTIAARQVIDG